MKVLNEIWEWVKNFKFKRAFRGAYNTLTFQSGNAWGSTYSWLMVIYEMLFLTVTFGGYHATFSFPSMFLGLVFFALLANILTVNTEYMDKFDLLWPIISLILLLVYLIMSIFKINTFGSFLSSLISLDLIKNLIKNIFDSKKKEKSAIEGNDYKINAIYNKIMEDQK